MSTVDPYNHVAALIVGAERAAQRLASQDPFGEWSRALSQVTLARIHSTRPSPLDSGDGRCDELLATALQAIDAIPGEQRRPSHSLDRAYIAGALAQVRDLQA